MELILLKLNEDETSIIFVYWGFVDRPCFKVQNSILSVGSFSFLGMVLKINQMCTLVLKVHRWVPVLINVCRPIHATSFFSRLYCFIIYFYSFCWWSKSLFFCRAQSSQFPLQYYLCMLSCVRNIVNIFFLRQKGKACHPCFVYIYCFV